MKKILIAAAALMAGSALAQAPAPAPAAPMAHPMADKIMTRNEVVAMVREHFGRMDADRDGAITTAEATQGHARLAGQMRGRRPGGAWQGEHARGMAGHETAMRDPNAAFDRLDSNKDGSISRGEFANGREQRLERRVVIQQGKKGAPGEAMRGRGMHRMGGMPGGRMVVMADTNHDGKITLPEAEALALQHFDRMDANHDGQVTPEEHRAGRPMMRKMIQDKNTNG
ncbi:MAG: EF-hand domain-containing protein [Sphingomicrobium sp.]